MARWWAEQHTSFNPLWLQKENWLMDNHLPTFKADLNKLTLGCHNKHLFRTTTAFQVALKKEWRRSFRIKLIARPIWLLDGSGVDGVMRQYKRWSVSEEWGVNTEHTQSRQEERVLAPKLSLLCLAILHLYTSSYIYLTSLVPLTLCLTPTPKLCVWPPPSHLSCTQSKEWRG